MIDQAFLIYALRSYKDLHMKNAPLLLLACLSFFAGMAQSNHIQPGKLYNAGDVIRSPRHGMQSRIPQGWRGVLPRDTEVFMILPDDPTTGKIFVFIHGKDTPQIVQKKFEQGVNFDANITLAPSGAIAHRGDAIASEFHLSSNQTDTAERYYAESKCNPHGGGCLMVILVGNTPKFDDGKAAVREVVDQTIFQAPSNESAYVDFDWKEFLSDKILVIYGYTGDVRKENEVNLCANGSFTSKLKTNGFVSNEGKQYQGKKSGTWTVKGKGESTRLVLAFKDLPEAAVTLTIQDEKVFVNGARYFAGVSDKCLPK